MNSQVLLKREVQKLLKNRKAVTFCNEVGLHPTALSQFLKGKRLLLRTAATKYFKNRIEPKVWTEIEERFVREETGWDFTVPNPSFRPLYKENRDNPVMSPDEHAMHADPMHSILLMAFYMNGFQPSLQWFLECIGITEAEALQRLERMERLGLLRRKNDFFEVTGIRPLYTTGVFNPAKVERWKAVAQKAVAAATLPALERSIGDYSFTLNPEDVPDIHRELLDLVARIDRRAMRSEPKGIYTLFFSLFPEVK